MHVNLTPKLDEYVLTKVKSGRYNNASEVVRDALRRMQDQEARQGATSNLTLREIDDIRNSVRQGIAEIERGEGQEYEGEEGLRQFFRELRTEAHRELQTERRKKTKRK